MKKRKDIRNIIRIFTAMCAALGWWGLLYPELTLTPETVRIVAESDSEDGLTDSRKSCSGDSLYLELLGTAPGNIRFRSRLLTELNAFWEAFSWDRSTEN